MELLQGLFILVGRVLISGVFLWGAYEKFRHYNASMSYMKSKGVPKVNIVLPITLGLKALGGFLVFFGWHAHIGALFLLLVTVPSVLKLHAFWSCPASEAQIEKMLFMKELAIVGGLLLLLALGSGQYGFGG
jgi:putative oxidoreductase